MRNYKNLPKVSWRIAKLVLKYQRGSLTDNEKIELSHFVKEKPENFALLQELSDSKTLEMEIQEFSQFDPSAAYLRVVAKMGKPRQALYTYLFTNNRRHFAAAVAAVAIVALSLICIWLWPKNTPAGNLLSQQERYKEEIYPAGKSAQLIYNLGVLNLQNIDTTIANDSTAFTVHKDGTIRYPDNRNLKWHSNSWNMLSTPESSDYMVALEDGTKVHLNAESSLSYPAHFSDSERVVGISGEGYFEVAPDKNRPFTVNANNVLIRAVGTAFNVNSHRQSGSGKVITIVKEGAVMVSCGRDNKEILVKAGEIASATKDSLSTVSKSNKVPQLIAWKDGRFSFEEDNLTAVVSELAAWYNIKFRFDDRMTSNKFFTGELNRNRPLSELLKTIELTGVAKFSISNRTVNVYPYL